MLPRKSVSVVEVFAIEPRLMTVLHGSKIGKYLCLSDQFCHQAVPRYCLTLVLWRLCTLITTHTQLAARVYSCLHSAYVFSLADLVVHFSDEALGA